MKRLFTIFATTIFISSQIAVSQNIKLPEPDKTGGMPLMQALKERSSSRDFSSRELNNQQISNLCWAGWGINRPSEEKRTAPSSQNKQEMELYVVLPDAAYRYNAIKHQLEMFKEGDIREYCGEQDFVATAPLNIVYVANMENAGAAKPGDITSSHIATSHANTGFMAQNVYLAAASQGLNCVVRGWIDKETLEEVMGLSPMHKVILGQTVGYGE